MKIKHTFLFTFVLGLFWVGMLFGYGLGPDPESNGIFGAAACNAGGCHVGNSLNAGGGTLTFTGLPALGWVAGQTYPLTVTIQRTGASRYGFQLSAVNDANNTQAGTLAAGSGVKVQTRSSIQYASHSFASSASSFIVNWTAPAATTGGRVRFNLAANAANGDFNTTGDFIYTLVGGRMADPAVAADPSIRSFTLSNRGGSLLRSDGVGSLVQGYTRIQPVAGSTAPSGLAIFGYRQNNVLVSESGVPASPLITAGRLYAEVSADALLNTGIAVANPNDSATTITFQITNTAGTVVPCASGSFQLAANEQRAAFLDGAPFSCPKPVQGAMTLTSTAPVSVIALRAFTNERSDFLMSTLPVVDTSLPASSGTQYIPHFADGVGFTTHILLVNPTDSPLTGTVQFYNQGSGATTPGTPTNVSIGGQVNISHPYSVAGRSSQRLSTAGTGTALAQGSVRVVPAGGGAVPVPLVVFTYKPGAFTLAEAGVPVSQGLAFRMYVELSGASGTAGSVETGFAIANTGTTSGDVTLELFNMDGTTTGLPTAVTRTLPASGQIVNFLTAFFPTLANPFRGVLRITTTTPGISVVGIRSRYNENTSYLMTTTPPTNEQGATSTAEFLFPHIVNGGGFTTEFVIFSGTTNQTSTGNLRFVKNDGTALTLTLN